MSNSGSPCVSLNLHVSVYAIAHVFTDVRTDGWTHRWIRIDMSRQARRFLVWTGAVSVLVFSAIGSLVWQNYILRSQVLEIRG